ncbi:MAG: FG-GAP-like repeat-containing protein, partial [Pirellulaceae bacterium]
MKTNLRFELLEHRRLLALSEFEVVPLPITGDLVYDIEVGDIDGDGIDDFLVSSNVWATGGTTSWYRSVNGDLEGPFLVFSGWLDTTKLVDIDGDNDLDLFASSGNYHALYRNVDGLGTFERVYQQNFGGTNMDAGDIDGDGDMDVVFSVNQEETIHTFWLENLGDDKWESFHI